MQGGGVPSACVQLLYLLCAWQMFMILNPTANARVGWGWGGGLQFHSVSNPLLSLSLAFDCFVTLCSLYARKFGSNSTPLELELMNIPQLAVLISLEAKQ